MSDIPLRSYPGSLAGPGGRDVTRYTQTAMALHWITSLFALAVLPLAWVAVSLPRDSAWKGFWFDMHKSVGLTIGALVVIRLLWRAVHHAPPEQFLPRGLAILARATHWLLYAVFLVMPISGFLLTSAGGRPVSVFYLFTIPALPKNEALQATADQIHLAGQWAVYALVSLHVLGAVWHVAIRRDGTLDRMLPPQGV